MPRKKSSDIPATLAWLRSELEQASDSKFAEGQRWFFKHEVDTWGVRTKELHRIARDLHHKVKSWPLADRNKLCTELWKSGKLEEGALVCYVYRRFKAECHECEFRLFERWLDRYVNNWAHCDGLSSWLLAASLANEPALTVELAGWTTSPNRWRRRAAAVSLIQEAKAGRHTEVIFDIAARLAADRDDMVEKGVGWLLKETYPKRAHQVTSFLTFRKHPFSRRTLRYAAEKMTPADSARVLGK